MSKSVLIIDDEKNIRITLKQALESDGLIVVTAVNGEDGLRCLSKQEFDVILVDMKMPGMDGIEFLGEARKVTSAAVIMMTAYGTVETAVQAMKLGAVDFLSKPFSPSSIRELVRDVLKRRELSEERVDSYSSALAFAKKCITERDLDRAERFLKKAIAFDATKPEAFNLIGILFELRGKFDEARRQYRAALALNPAYQPAEDNLHRASDFRYRQSGMNLGEDFEEDDNSLDRG